MIKEVIDYILDIASKHKEINYVEYGDRSLFNRSNENKSYQFFIEDVNYLRQENEGINQLELNCYILGFVDDTKNNLDIQDEALHIWSDIYQYLDNDADIQISIGDFDLLSLSEYTTDKDAGIRITLRLYVPNVVDKCSYLDNFDFEPIPIEWNASFTTLSNSSGIKIKFGYFLHNFIESIYILDLDKTIYPEDIEDGYYFVEEDKEYTTKIKFKEGLVSLEQAFYTSGVVEVKKDLFSGCNDVTNINDLFSSSDLRVIEEKTLDVFTNVTNCNSIFSGCKKLENIDNLIFDKLTNVTSFLSCFSGCINLITIPKYLFSNNKKVNTFQNIFYNCSKLITMPKDKYSDGSEKYLWERTGEFNVVEEHLNAFEGCVQIEGFEQIPEDWR